MIKKVVMPAAGQTTDVATVTKLKVRVGDSVRKGDILMEVETDKAVLPIESFAKGLIVQIFVNEFDRVDAGTPLLAIGDENDLAAADKNAGPAPEADAEDDFAPVIPSSPAPVAQTEKATEKPVAAVAPVSAAPVSAAVPAMPNAKKLAAELGIALDSVKPSNGVFIKADDVRKAEPKTAPAADIPELTVPTARIRKTLARRWDDSAKIPAFSITVTASPVAADALHAADATIDRVHYVMLALAKLACRYPMLRVRFADGVQKLSETADIGLAVYAENGTVSSAVTACDRLSLTAVAAACGENQKAVGKGDLSSVGGAALTVFDVSGYGVDSFTPPLSAPETAAFGVAGDETKLTVTGTFDIRVYEGNIGASIMSDLRARLNNPALMLV